MSVAAAVFARKSPPLGDLSGSRGVLSPLWGARRPLHRLHYGSLVRLVRLCLSLPSSVRPRLR